MSVSRKTELENKDLNTGNYIYFFVFILSFLDANASLIIVLSVLQSPKLLYAINSTLLSGNQDYAKFAASKEAFGLVCKKSVDYLEMR